jgi:hypothetical protein
VSVTLLTTILFDSVVFSLAFAVGLVALAFYFNKKKTGLLVIAIAFLLSAFLGVFNGVTITDYFISLGWTTYQTGLYKSAMGFGSLIAFTVLMLAGLAILSREMS